MTPVLVAIFFVSIAVMAAGAGRRLRRARRELEAEAVTIEQEAIKRFYAKGWHDGHWGLPDRRHQYDGMASLAYGAGYDDRYGYGKSEGFHAEREQQHEWRAK